MSKMTFAKALEMARKRVDEINANQEEGASMSKQEDTTDYKMLAEYPTRREDVATVRIVFNIEGLHEPIVKTREVNDYVDDDRETILDDDWIRQHGMREWGRDVWRCGIPHEKDWYPPHKIESASWELVDIKRGLPRIGGFRHFRHRTI